MRVSAVPAFVFATLALAACQGGSAPTTLPAGMTHETVRNRLADACVYAEWRKREGDALKTVTRDCSCLAKRLEPQMSEPEAAAFVATGQIPKTTQPKYVQAFETCTR
ncbi:hypothetical protein [Afifella sp. JA880]|uniref:hypothetical protein n=1 Tax=unclassified Afifella TaxID=2624128 RepID=UPI0021BBB3D6|nr:hypothetical protein [Afifella sp. JA880]MCT8265908.1 hypothetical protein [Afifella sp. JA880]